MSGSAQEDGVRRRKKDGAEGAREASAATAAAPPTGAAVAAVEPSSAAHDAQTKDENAAAPLHRPCSLLSRVLVCPALLLPMLLALLLFHNSLHGAFVYDDHFALVDNRDTDPRTTEASALWTHDFWGASMSSPGSHKSFRPLTILSWRAQRAFVEAVMGSADAADVLPAGKSKSRAKAQAAATAPLASLRSLFLRLATPAQNETQQPSVASMGITPATAAGASVLLRRPWYPFIFHASNVMLHAVCTGLVFVFALGVFSDDGADATQHTRATLLSFVSSLLFAVHPVHTEAVSGIVGHAELLCATCFLLGLVSWQQRPRSRLGRFFCTSVGLAALAAATLSKEIGLTLVAIYAVMDVLRAARALSAGPPRGVTGWIGGILRQVWLRVLLCMLLSGAYLSWRHALTGGSALSVGQAVFRRVENPLAFEFDRTTRVRSLAMLHAKYAELLIFPLRELSADYSYDCLPLVRSFNDTRWVPGVALWVAFVGAALVSALRLRKALCTLSTSRGAAKRDDDSQVASSAAPLVTVEASASFHSALLLSLAMVFASFLPSSNLLFFIGTFVAERLLFIPSIGYSLLVALVLERLVLLRWCGRRQPDDGTAPISSAPMRWTPLRVLLCLVLLSPLVFLFSSLTMARNPAWSSERALFTSALRVCPRSVKTLQNWGILLRRDEQHKRALEVFESIGTIVAEDEAAAAASGSSVAASTPQSSGYCESGYWIALSRINLGDVRVGIEGLKTSLSTCPFTRTQALAALHKLFDEIRRNNRKIAEHEARKERQEKKNKDKKKKKKGQQVEEEEEEEEEAEKCPTKPTKPKLPLSPSAMRAQAMEWSLLAEWSDILQRAGAAESATRYALHAAHMAHAAGNYTAAIEHFGTADQRARKLRFDEQGEVLPSAEVSGAAGGGHDMRLREEGTAPASEIAAINLRCASMYWLGRSHMQQGAVMRALPLLRSVVEASLSSPDAEKAVGPLSSREGLTELPVPDISIPGRNCSEFKMVSLDHITAITKAQLDRFAAAIAAHYSPSPAAKPMKGTAPKATKPAADTASKLPSTSERVEAHERMAFVLSHLAKNEQAASHLHAAGMMLEGKWTGDGAAAAATAAANYASSLPSTATRLRAIALYRAALRLSPTLERARYSLALSLVESQTDVDGGARMLRDLIAGSTDPQVKANAEAAIKLMQQAHSAQKAAATKKSKRVH